MPSPRSIGIAVAFAVSLLAANASADPAPSGTLHMRSPSKLTVHSGKEWDLPPGYFLPEPDYTKVDEEMKRRGDEITRLTAENDSFRKDAASWRPGWVTLSTAFLTGIVVTYYVTK